MTPDLSRPIFLAFLMWIGLCQGAFGQALPTSRPAPEQSPAHHNEHPSLTLTALIQLGLEQNPNLRMAAFDVDAARGRALQAGLYPNPTATTILDELGDRTGPAGVNTLPLVSQEIVTGRKLSLSRSVGEREADQYIQLLLRQRFVLFTTVRTGYFEVLTLRERIAVLEELVRLAEESYAVTQKLLKTGQVANLDVVTFEVERYRFKADLEAARREEAAAWRKLAAEIGVPNLPNTKLDGALDSAAPSFDFEHARDVMLAIHPEVQAAESGVARAQLALRRAQVEPNLEYVRSMGDKWRAASDIAGLLLVGAHWPGPPPETCNELPKSQHTSDAFWQPSGEVTLPANKQN